MPGRSAEADGQLGNLYRAVVQSQPPRSGDGPAAALGLEDAQIDTDPLRVERDGARDFLYPLAGDVMNVAWPSILAAAARLTSAGEDVENVAS